MGNLCSCMEKKKPKCIVSVIGLEEDVKHILACVVPNFDTEMKLAKFSEFIITYNRKELILNVHLSSPMIKNLINLHSKAEFSTIYAINVDNKTSLETAKSIVDDQERIPGRIVSVLCRGRYLDNPELDELKSLFHETIHDTFDFIKFYEKDTNNKVKLTFEKICNRLSED